VSVEPRSALGLAVKRGLRRCRMATAFFRVLPDFIIIGANRAGTTSLYNYLVTHPHVAPALRKEVHFFDMNFDKGLRWYRAHFPTTFYRSWMEARGRRPLLSGEASPYYLFHPHVPHRIFTVLPRVKLVALLRDPVDRAHSHYHHQVSKGREPLSLEEALAKEAERLEGETARLVADERYYSYNHRRYSYLARGIYVDQLKAWLDLFAREQILIIKSEDLSTDPDGIMRQVCDFLSVPVWSMPAYPKYHRTDYPAMEVRVRRQLVEYFRPHNRRLYEFLGRDFGWESH